MSEITRVALFGKLNTWPTRPSRARRSSASCAATRTSSWCTGSTRSSSSRTPTCTASCARFRSIRSRLAQDLTESLDRLPRGRDVDLRSLVPRRGSGRARLGLRQPDVRRRPRCAPAISSSACSRRPALRNALAGSRASSTRSRSDRLTDEFDAIVAGSPEDGAGPGEAEPSMRRPGDASGAMPPAADGQAGGAAPLLRRSDRPRAQGRDRSDRSAATRRSGRSSTS